MSRNTIHRLFRFSIERKFGVSKYIQTTIANPSKKTSYASKRSIQLYIQHCNLHCIRAGFSGFIEVAFRQKQVLRQPLPHLVQVPHVEQRLQCSTEAAGGMGFGGIFGIPYSVPSVCVHIRYAYEEVRYAVHCMWHGVYGARYVVRGLWYGVCGGMWRGVRCAVFDMPVSGI